MLSAERIIGPQRLFNLQHIFVSVSSLHVILFLSDPACIFFPPLLFALGLLRPFYIWTEIILCRSHWKQIWTSVCSWNNFKLSQVMSVIYELLWWCNKFKKKIFSWSGTVVRPNLSMPGVLIGRLGSVPFFFQMFFPHLVTLYIFLMLVLKSVSVYGTRC